MYLLFYEIFYTQDTSIPRRGHRRGSRIERKKSYRLCSQEASQQSGSSDNTIVHSTAETSMDYNTPD
jgi:hypothetical protein